MSFRMCVCVFFLFLFISHIHSHYHITCRYILYQELDTTLFMYVYTHICIFQNINRSVSNAFSLFLFSFIFISKNLQLFKRKIEKNVQIDSCREMRKNDSFSIEA